MIVFCNGCFDFPKGGGLHEGHLHFLRQARSFGRWLIVGVNRDESVRRLKGQGRPLSPFYERILAIERLSFVNCVLGFNEPDPSELIRRLRPDILVKGEEYAPGGKPCPERAVAEAYGGNIVYIPRLPGISTTEILNG